MASIYGVTSQTVCNWVRQGLPVAERAQKLKRKVYLFDRDQVRDWVENIRSEIKCRTLEELWNIVDGLTGRVALLEQYAVGPPFSNRPAFDEEGSEEARFKELEKELQEMDKKFADTFTPEMEAELNAELEKAEKELGDLIK